MSDVETVILAMSRDDVKDHDGVQRPPILVEVATYQAPEWTAFHVAEDAEIEAYETYWNGACPRCGKERGECQLSHA